MVLTSPISLTLEATVKACEASDNLTQIVGYLSILNRTVIGRITD